MTHRYELYGLTVASELDLHGFIGLAEVSGRRAGSPDVRIVCGAAPPPPAIAVTVEPWIRVAEGSVFLTVPGLARFVVTAGELVFVAPAPDADPVRLRAILLATAFSILIHQRGWLPLHASVVEVAGGCVAFAGHSGAGKSTLAAEFGGRGYRVVSDDVAVVVPAPGAQHPWTVRPGISATRLQPDALARLGLSARGLAAVDPDLEKYLVPWPREPSSSPRQLLAIVLLSLPPALDPAATVVQGAAAVGALLAHVHRPAVVAPLGRSADVFQALAALAARVPVVPLPAWSVPRSPELVADAVLAALTPLLGCRPSAGSVPA